MLKTIFNRFGKRAAQQAVQAQTRSGGLLDIRFGFSLFRDRRVSLFTKLFALGLGAALTALLIGLEFPIETIIAAMLNLLGIGLDSLVDGMEALIGPVLFAALLLPHLTPRELIYRKRSEQAGVRIDSVVDEPAPTSPAYLAPRS